MATITVDVLREMVARGWRPVRTSGMPDTVMLQWRTEHPTPDWARPNWPGETYPASTVMIFTVTGDTVREVIVREHACPWVTSTEHGLSRAAALKHIVFTEKRISDA